MIYLRVGDRVKIADELFPLRFGKVGIVDRNRSNGMFDIKLESGELVRCVFSDEVELIDRRCLQCNSGRISVDSPTGRCEKCRIPSEKIEVDPVTQSWCPPQRFA